jgi:DNA-binding protein HU-beta
MSLNATELAAKIAENHALTKTAAAAIVKDVFETIQGELTDGDGVSIHGFGTFKTVERAARTARNPINGAAIEVPAKRTAKFVPAKALKDLLN